ncbi:zinc-ribbon domain-containing protein [Bradyrhizobium sp. BRP22]|uniref:zinc-ribbon domain-containing protein n=1 Tax=Bradyrhizobium sp. BRP22 TaxID=2793821 RepID=UPI001CD2ED1D|nr:zinc-ribbon domain-containing protein [Bradyrhizobium sp. BRP22]
MLHGAKMPRSRRILSRMLKSDVQCPRCEAGYRRIEVESLPGRPGEFRCLVCNEVLERYSGTPYVAHRLTVQPEKMFG